MQQNPQLSPFKFFITLKNFSAQIHLFHFQTNSGFEHETLGKLYSDIESNIDTIFEAYMGCYGRFPIDEMPECEFKNYTDVDLYQYVSTIYMVVKEAHDHFELEEKVELVNILQDFLSILSKYKYLITMR